MLQDIKASLNVIHIHDALNGSSLVMSHLMDIINTAGKGQYFTYYLVLHVKSSHCLIGTHSMIPAHAEFHLVRRHNDTCNDQTKS